MKFITPCKLTGLRNISTVAAGGHFGVESPQILTLEGWTTPAALPGISFLSPPAVTSSMAKPQVKTRDDTSKAG